MYLARFQAWLMVLICVTFISFQARANNDYYGRSYAVVIGIDEYNSSTWVNLPYAKKDAQGVGQFLQTQSFEVSELYDKDATKVRIKSKIQKLARRLKSTDRVVVFFSGHGHTESFAGEDFGYIVPYDGTGESATFISMEELREL